MLTVSLHGIRMQAPLGLYAEEHILGNEFEIDVDVFVHTDANSEWPFVDYTLIHQIVSDTFAKPGQLLETFAKNIHSKLRTSFPYAGKARVAIRKLNPPMSGDVKYSQVCFEA